MRTFSLFSELPTPWPLLAHERRLKTDREKSARYRERQATAKIVADRQRAEGVERDATGELTRVSRPGWSDLYRNPRTVRRNAKPPASLTDDPGFGQPGYPRHALGHVPPDRAHVRVVFPPNERGVAITRPVERRDLDAALAPGARLA